MKYLHSLDARQVISLVKEYNEIFVDYRPFNQVDKKKSKSSEKENKHYNKT